MGQPLIPARIVVVSNLTAAQTAQQNNRDHGGRYAEKAGADPGDLGLSLDLPEAAAPIAGPGFDHSGEAVAFDESSGVLTAPDGTTFTIPGRMRSTGGYTGHGHEGDRSARMYRPNAEVAKDIRADLKAAVTCGWLPSNLKYSVTSNIHAIDVRIVGLADEHSKSTPEHPPRFGDRGLQHHAAVLRDRVDAVRRRYGSYDSDGGIDYFNDSYYGSTHIETDADAAFRASEAARRKR